VAYTKLKTWNNGDLILAAEVQGEIDNLREYVRQLPSNAVAATDWLDAKHVMKGEYTALTNTAQFCSGVWAGLTRKHPDGYHTYSTVYNTLRIGTTVWEYMPGTSLTLEIRRPMTVMINWYAQGAGRNNDSAGALGESDVKLYVGNKSLRYGPQAHLYEEDSLSTSYYREQRYYASGFHIEDYNAVGIYNVGLVTQNTSSKTEFWSWGLSVEAFNL